MKTSAIVPTTNTWIHPSQNPAARAGRRTGSENQRAHSEVSLGLVTTCMSFDRGLYNLSLHTREHK
jgi:hypothetical protein